MNSAVDIAVDAAAGVVRVGAQQWPFDLDLHAGAAALWVSGQRISVRPLLWREKVMLARFAHLGPRFVQQHFLRLALGGRPLPRTGKDEAENKAANDAANDALDEAVTAALVALAQWIDSPDASRPRVPLDPVALGRVALAVCRGTGLRPADLDTRPAAEVELLWQAVTQAEPGQQAGPAAHAAPAAAEDDGQVRILIVPDPAPVQPHRPTGADDPGGAQQPVSPPHAPEPAAHRAPASPMDSETGEAVEPPRRGPEAPPVSSVPLSTPLAPSRKTDAQTDAPQAQPSPSARRSSKSQSGNGQPVKSRATPFRLFYPTPDARGPGAAAALMPNAGTVQAQAYPVHPARLAPLSMPEPAAVRAAPRPAVSGRAALPQGELSTPMAAHTQPPAYLAEKDAADAAAFDWERLLEELSERLAQAAAELGIDLEG